METTTTTATAQQAADAATVAQALRRTAAAHPEIVAVRTLDDSVSLTWSVTASTAEGLAHLARGKDTNQVSSSVGIVRTSAQAWRAGLRDFLFVLGLISLALGLLNLLPVLPLDGGHIVMALVEKLRGRTFPNGNRALACLRIT